MLRIIQVIIVAGILLSCHSAKQNHQEVLLVGTVHTATQKVNADSIYNILVQFRPDIILMELDSSFFYEDFTYKSLFDGNEMIATTRYKMNYPHVQLRPIEFEGREAYREKLGIYPEITEAFGMALQRLSVENRLAPHDQITLARLFYFDSLITSLKEESLAVINSGKTDAIVDSLNHYKYEGLKRISGNYGIFRAQKLLDAKGDSVTLKENFDLYADFEARKRNEALANHALSFISSNPGKRIIILVGFAHRSFMLKAFRKQPVEVRTDPYRTK